MKKLVWLPSSILCLLLALFLFNSCNRNDDPIDPQVDIDTIFPSEYIPAYPGSWWKYSDGSEIKAGKYTLYSLERVRKNDLCGIDNLSLVTKKDSCYAPLYGRTQLFGTYGISSQYGLCFLVPLVDLDDQKEEHFVRRYEDKVDYYFDESLDTAVSINGQIYEKARTTKHYLKEGGAPSWLIDSSYTRYIYAPGVGLIRKEIKRFGSPIKQVDLIDYHINR